MLLWIRQWPIIRFTSPFPNDEKQNYPFLDYNKWLKRLDIQLNEITNQNSIKVPKAIKPTNKNIIIKLWELV